VKTKLCDINAEAEKKLPPASDDKSGIGVHYVDAFIKPMNVKLAGAKKGEGLMRRLDVSRDPIVMLNAALQEAAKSAGVDLTVEDGGIFLAL
jgi:hypothetical protein